MSVIAGSAPLPVPEPSPLAATDAVSRRPGSIAQWRSTGPNAWIGLLSARLALGTVRRDGVEYVASDARGAELGRFTSLSEAESAVGATILDVATERDRLRQRLVVIVAAVSGVMAVATAAIGLLVLSM